MKEATEVMAIVIAALLLTLAATKLEVAIVIGALILGVFGTAVYALLTDQKGSNPDA